jgi:parallel beta-helix repeat protein
VRYLGCSIGKAALSKVIKLSIYNVLNYGAIGDNSTDNSVAIQTAINTANASGGGTIYFPDGIYIVATTLILYSNITICGQSKWSSIIKLANTSTNCLFNISGISGTPKINMCFNNIKLMHKYGGAATTPPSTTGNLQLIFAKYTGFVQITNCVFGEYSSAAIYIEQIYPGHAFYSWLIQGNIFLGDIANGWIDADTYGVYCKNAAEYIDFTGNTFTYLITGVYLRNSANCKVFDNSFNACQTGIVVGHDDITYNAGKTLISSNTCNHCSIAGISVNVYGRTSNIVSMQLGTIITSNMILLPSSYGIKVAGGWGHIITNNRILTDTDGDAGIWILDKDADNKLSYALVSNNSVMCNVATTTGIITNDATGDGNSVTGNILVIRP